MFPLMILLAAATSSPPAITTTEPTTEACAQYILNVQPDRPDNKWMEDAVTGFLDTLIYAQKHCVKSST